MNKPVLRIVQWREFGDDDDTQTFRVIHPENDQSDEDFIREAFDLEAIPFDDGGITIVNSIDIMDGETISDDCGNKLVVNLTAVASHV